MSEERGLKVDLEVEVEVEGGAETTKKLSFVFSRPLRSQIQVKYCLWKVKMDENVPLAGVNGGESRTPRPYNQSDGAAAVRETFAMIVTPVY
jgi:hypothetical protein